MSSPDGSSPTSSERGANGGPPGPSGARNSRSLVAPAIALIAVVALAIAALTGGSGGDPVAEDAAVPDEQPLATEDPGEPAGDADAPGDAAGAAPEQATPQDISEEDRALLDGLARREADDPRALGDVDAPVVLIEWADFLCSYCGVHARDTEPELIDRYVEAGILRIEWRDLPLQGEEALLAALAGQAAAEQDAFWDLHEALFEAGLRRGDGQLSREFLTTTAEELGLDVARFEASLDDPATLTRVQEDAALGQQLGITGTPAFIVGGRPMVGAQPLERFAALIELAAAESGVAIP